MQVPSGNRFQYQLSLNGKTDTIEIWQDATASDADFSPLFKDDAEAHLYQTPVGERAKVVPAGDGDCFLEFAFPVSVPMSYAASPAGLSPRSYPRWSSATMR